MRNDLPLTLRIATRSSALAMVQANLVKQHLLKFFPSFNDSDITLVPMSTTGDNHTHQSLAALGGGKGLFTYELEVALKAGVVDMAVHSMKDVPIERPDGMTIACILPREDVRDALISNQGDGLATLPSGAVVGTSSVRRKAQLLNLRPDLKIVDYRGNVPTRLKNLAEKQVDATMLAMAGLKRLNVTACVTEILDTEVMLPALAQGAIGIECMMNQTLIYEMLKHINHQPSWVTVTTERSFLQALGGGCTTPVAGLAKIKEGNSFIFQAIKLHPEGKTLYKVERCGAVNDAEMMAKDAAYEIILEADF